MNYLTGWEFKVLRMFSNVSQKSLAVKLGMSEKSCYAIYKRERDYLLPPSYLQALSELSGINYVEMEKEDAIAEFIKKIPFRFKNVKRLRRYNGDKSKW